VNYQIYSFIVWSLIDFLIQTSSSKEWSTGCLNLHEILTKRLKEALKNSKEYVNHGDTAWIFLSKIYSYGKVLGLNAQRIFFCYFDIWSGILLASCPNDLYYWININRSLLVFSSEVKYQRLKWQLPKTWPLHQSSLGLVV
jgi:hypothetical protein